MLTTLPQFNVLFQALPLDNVVRLEVNEGVLIFRALPQIQKRIEELVEKQQSQPLSSAEKNELAQFEELDEFLSLVNRLVRNLMQGNGSPAAHGTPA